jgi:microcystin-dependent protein
MSAIDPSTLGTGIILMWSGEKTNIPAGWHDCDGTLLSTSTYAHLYSIIGLSYGASPPQGQFYLPDLRGQFVRGVDEGAGVDPDVTDRHDMRNPSVSYSGVGSVQASALQTHTHSYNEVVSSSNGSIDDAHAYTSSSQSTGAPAGANVSQYETRPVNAYLYYIIKL